MGCSRRDVDQRLGGRRRVAHRLGREDGEHAVAAWVVHEGRRGGRVAGSRRRPRPRRRDCRGRRSRAGQALSFSSVSGVSSASSPPSDSRRSEAMTPGPPALVTMPEARAARAGHAREHLGRVEHVLDLVHADDARAAEDGAVERVVAGDRAGVRGGRQGGAGVAAALHDDDRLGLGEVARGAHEVARVGDRLDVEDDRARVLVGAEVVDEVAEVDVAHGADADERREAHLVRGRPVEDRRAQGAGLAEEGDPALRRCDVGEGHVEVAGGPGVAEAVGADDAQAVGLGDGPHLLLELAALGADLAEARADDDGAGDSGLTALADRCRGPPWRARR